jgi:hypothetical protein
MGAMGVQKHYKKRFTKEIVSKSFYKKFDQKSETDFFSNFFYHVFGRFSMRGVQKHDKKNIKKINLTLVPSPSPFSYSDPPTTHPPRGSPTFFLPVAGPLENTRKGDVSKQPLSRFPRFFGSCF